MSNFACKLPMSGAGLERERERRNGLSRNQKFCSIDAGEEKELEEEEEEEVGIWTWWDKRYAAETGCLPQIDMQQLLRMQRVGRGRGRGV